MAKWWFLADDPAADPQAPEEVRQAAMPSRKFKLPVQFPTVRNYIVSLLNIFNNFPSMISF